MGLNYETIFLWIATALYVGQAGALLYSGKLGLAVAFAGYAVANLGLIWAVRAS